MSYSPNLNKYLTVATARTNNGQKDVRVILDIQTNDFYTYDDDGNFLPIGSGNPYLIQFTDTDNYVYNRNFGGSIDFQTVNFPSFEGWLNEIYVDSNNYFYNNINNFQNTIAGGNGSFDFGEKIEVRDVDNKLTQEIKKNIYNLSLINTNVVETSNFNMTNGQGVSMSNQNTLYNTDLKLVTNTGNPGFEVNFNDLTNGDGLKIFSFFNGLSNTVGFLGFDNGSAESITLQIETDPSRLANFVQLQIVNLPVYADNASALAGGLITNAVYKTATGELRIVV